MLFEFIDINIQLENENQTYMSWLYEQVKSVTPNLTMDDFIEIINQPDFDIENYIISKNISIETEKLIDKDLLYIKWLEFESKNQNDDSFD